MGDIITLPFKVLPAFFHIATSVIPLPIDMLVRFAISNRVFVSVETPIPLEVRILITSLVEVDVPKVELLALTTLVLSLLAD
jgi:hypothetical protein